MDKLSPPFPEPAIDGPWRVDSYGARIVAARNGSGFEELRLIDYCSLAIYGSFGDSSVGEILRHSLSWINRQPDSMLSVNAREPYLPEGSKDSGADPAEVRRLIRDLVGYGNAYGDLLNRAGLTWSPNGKYFVAVISLDSDSLSDPETRSLLFELLTLAESTPLRPILLIENPRRVPPEIQQKLSWQAFIGADQVSYSRDRYAMEIAPGMASRIAIGVAIDRITETARVLNSLGYEPTEDALERKHAIADDTASYERFLEGLTDGK